jgi:hypothetical protein
MKKMKSKLIVLSILFATFCTSSVFAQFTQIGSFMTGSVDDAEKLFGAYISPYANGIGAGLSAGWYNTAKPHKLGGFDVTITLNTAIIPSADKSFNPASLGLGEGNSIISRVDVSGDSPTAAGSKDAGPVLTYYTDVPGLGETELASFELPKGSGIAYTMNPMLQVGIGLAKGTDISIRYSPELKIGDAGKVGLWGIGLKHSIKQWIPVLEKLPLFEMTLQGGYTKLYSVNDISFQPEFYAGDDVTIINFFPNYYDNQQMLLDISNTTVNLLLSADLKVVCFYGGVGISSTKTNLKLEGNYPFPELQTGGVIVSNETAIKDPIDITIKSNDGSVTKPRLNAGIRFKMAVVTFHFDYTYANYSIASAGLGISFR